MTMAEGLKGLPSMQPRSSAKGNTIAVISKWIPGCGVWRSNRRRHPAEKKQPLILYFPDFNPGPPSPGKAVHVQPSEL